MTKWTPPTNEQATELLRSKGMCGHVSLQKGLIGDHQEYRACILTIGHDSGVHEPRSTAAGDIDALDTSDAIRRAWARFDPFPRWRKAEIAHHPDCLSRASPGDAPWDVCPTETLTGAQWLHREKLEVAAKTAQGDLVGAGLTGTEVTVRPARDHMCRCTNCYAKAAAVSVQVVMVVGLRYMVKEFAL